MDFLSTTDASVLKQVRSMNQPEVYGQVKQFFDALVSDRKSLMMGDIFRSLIFILIAAGILFLLVRNTLKPIWAILLLIVFSFADIITIDYRARPREEQDVVLRCEQALEGRERVARRARKSGLRW